MIIGNIRVEAWSPSLAFSGFGFWAQALRPYDSLKTLCRGRIAFALELYKINLSPQFPENQFNDD